MVTSQNGFSANDRSQIQTYQIGGKTKVALRKGPTGWLLQHLGNWFDANIRDIDPGILDDWGYAERPIRGGTELSNHASGTALDVDATKWPLGVEPTKYLTKAEIAKLKNHLGIYEGAIRWGGDYTGRKDPMHFEIDKPEAFCARIQSKLQSSPGYTPPSEEDDMTPEEHQMLAEVRDRLRGDKARPYDMLQSIESLAEDASYRIRGTHPAMDALQVIQWQVAQLAAAAPANVDEGELAAALAAAIPDDIAEQVAQKLADRLAS